MRQGPFMVQIGQLFSFDLETTDKLEFTAWFEVNRTFSSRDIPILILDGLFGPSIHDTAVVYRSECVIPFGYLFRCTMV